MTKEKCVEFLKVATARGFLPGLARDRVKEVFHLDDFDLVTDEQLDLAMFSLKRNYKELHDPVVNDNGEILPLIDDSKMIPEKIHPEIYRCPGPKHGTEQVEDRPIVPIGEFCSEGCRSDYYPDRPKTNFDEFLERGRKKHD